MVTYFVKYLLTKQKICTLADGSFSTDRDLGTLPDGSFSTDRDLGG